MMPENNSRKELQELLSEFIEVPLKKTYENQIGPKIETIEQSLVKIINKQINQTDELNKTLKTIISVNGEQTETLNESIEEMLKNSISNIETHIKNVISKQDDLQQRVEKQIEINAIEQIKNNDALTGAVKNYRDDVTSKLDSIQQQNIEQQAELLTQQLKNNDALTEAFISYCDNVMQNLASFESNSVNKTEQLGKSISKKLWIFLIATVVGTSVLSMILTKFLML